LTAGRIGLPAIFIFLRQATKNSAALFSARPGSRLRGGRSGGYIHIGLSYSLIYL